MSFQGGGGTRHPRRRTRGEVGSLDLREAQVGPVLLLLREAVLEDFSFRASDDLRQGALELPQASFGEHSWLDFRGFGQVHPIVGLDASYRVAHLVSLSSMNPWV